VQVPVNTLLGRLNGLFNEMYADGGRASIAPEKPLRGLLLQVLYSIRSEPGRRYVALVLGVTPCSPQPGGRRCRNCPQD